MFTFLPSRIDSELPGGVKIGDLVNKAVIYESSQSGIYLKVGGGCRGFCQNIYLSSSDQPLKQVKNKYPAGSTRDCRVLKYCYMDQLFNVSLQRNVTEQQVNTVLLYYIYIVVGECHCLISNWIGVQLCMLGR